MAHDPNEFPEPPQLRLLRRLVTGLVVVLIVGVLAIAGTIVIRLGLGIGGALSGGPIRAESFRLPAGAEIVAVGRGPDSVMFVLRRPDGAEALQVFDEKTGEPVSTTRVLRDAR